MIHALITSIARLFPPLSPAARGERIAERHLKKLGYRILARNLRNRFGEIDLLAEAEDGRTIVIVEVKSSTPANEAVQAANPRPEVRVNLHKQRKLAGLAMQVVRRFGWENRPVRFDVIGVDMPAKGAPVVRHHVAAFESPW